MKLPRSRILSYLLAYWRYRLTTPARLLLAGVFISGFLGAFSLSVPLYHLFFVLFWVYTIAFLAGVIFKPRIRISGELPPKISTGHTLRADLVLENSSRLSAYDISVGLFGLPPSLEQVDRDESIAVIGPGGAGSFPLKIRARKRGLYALPKLQSYTTFPFALFRRRGPSAEAGSLLVLPEFHPLVDISIPVGRRHQPGGIALTSNIGESPEYVGNREYRPGDPTKRIDFRSWARLAKPVVREFQEEYYCRLALVLDTYIPRGRRKKPDGFPELEAAISLSAAIADALARGEYIIDIFAAGPELYVFRGGRSIGHLDNILEILACIEECRANPFDAIGPALADELSNITAVVFVLLDWDEDREKFVRAAVEAGTTARAFIVREKETTRPFASAEEWAGPISRFSPEDIRSYAVDSL